jgi:hypothetical protein
MKKTLRKMKFFIVLFLLPIRSFLEKTGLNFDLIELGNDIYRDDFLKIPIGESAVLLPHCLIDRECPAKFSKDDGILCIKCNRCRCGEIKKLSEECGYQFYITPSVGFTKRLAQRKKIRAAIGTTCLYEIEKGLQTERITPQGVDLNKNKVIPQVLLTREYNCLVNDIDWERLKRMITDRR